MEELDDDYYEDYVYDEPETPPSPPREVEEEQGDEDLLARLLRREREYTRLHVYYEELHRRYADSKDQIAYPPETCTRTIGIFRDRRLPPPFRITPSMSKLERALLKAINPTFKACIERANALDASRIASSANADGSPSAEQLMAGQVYGYGSKSDLATAITTLVGDHKAMKWCDHMYSGYEMGSASVSNMANTSPPGLSMKPFNLDQIAGEGCVPIRESRVWRAYEHILGSWPPPHARAVNESASASPEDEFFLVDWAVGSFERRPREAAAQSPETSLILEALTTFTALPSVLELERELDMEVAASLPPSTVDEIREEITKYGFPTYRGTQIVSGFS